MKTEIKLTSRYGDAHRLVPVPEIGDDTYKFVPAKSWMPMYYNYDGMFGEDMDEFDLISVDTDGGPYLSAGDKVEGMEIKRIYVKKGVGVIIQF